VFEPRAWPSDFGAEGKDPKDFAGALGGSVRASAMRAAPSALRDQLLAIGNGA
jgi:hypothetical protein